MRIVSYLQNPERRATGILFFVNALFLGNWAVRIPDVKRTLELSDAQLGFALLASPLGIILFTPVTTWAINRYGTGTVSIVAGLWTAITIIGLGLPSTYLGLIVALFLFGMGNGAFDIAMNGVASAIEKKQKVVIMSMTHGFWSLGAMIASLIASWFIAFHISYTIHFIIVAIFCALIIIMMTPSIKGVVDEAESTFRWVWPGTYLTLLVGIVFIVFMVEGGVIDWNALYYEQVIDSPREWIGVGFAAFAGAMALFRFLGDRFIEQYSSQIILRVGILTAAVGLFIFSQFQSIIICTIAMAIIGGSCSVLVPIVFREAGRSRIVSPSLGLALVATLGYAGFLVGPPMLGFISQSYGLNNSFLFLSVLLLIGFVFTLGLRKQD